MDLNQDFSLYWSENESGSTCGSDTSSEAPGSPGSDPLPAEDAVAFCFSGDHGPMWSPALSIPETSNKPESEDVAFIVDDDLRSVDGLRIPEKLPYQFMEGEDERSPVKSEEKANTEDLMLPEHNQVQSVEYVAPGLTLSGQIQSFKKAGNGTIFTVLSKNSDLTIDSQAILGTEAVFQLKVKPRLPKVPKVRKKQRGRGAAGATQGGPYRCTLCGKPYAFKSGLSRHKSINHSSGPKRFNCPKCKRFFTRSDSLADHIEAKGHFSGT